jgi:dolichyl-phosphate-mannose--protein O-mannosyl transferase
MIAGVAGAAISPMSLIPFESRTPSESRAPNEVRAASPVAVAPAGRLSRFANSPLGVALAGLLIFAGALALFRWGVEAARDVYFDETWYVPAARALLKNGEILRPEHPPLGKMLIEASIALFGDNPLGWRAASVLAGAVTLTAVFAWSRALLGNTGQALFATAVTLCDGILYVQSRVAMLDVFLMAFGALALTFFTLALKERSSSRRALIFANLCGLSLGLATACKLSGLFLWAGMVAILLLIGLMRLWRVRFEEPRAEDFYASREWPALSLGGAIVAFFAAPLLGYFLTYLPQIVRVGSVVEFFAAQRRMIDIMTGVSATHPYSSLWYAWPAMTRPVWALFQVVGGNAGAWSAQHPALSIVGLANPFVFYPGEIAILFCLWLWIARRNVNGMIVAVAFFAQYLPWAVNPKGLEFFYYYFPSILCLGPALALALFRSGVTTRFGPALGFLVVAALAFAFFLPVYSAQFPLDPDGFAARIWFEGWR